MTSNCINNDVFGSLIGFAMEILRNQRRRQPFNKKNKKQKLVFLGRKPFLKAEDDLKCGLGPY